MTQLQWVLLALFAVGMAVASVQSDEADDSDLKHIDVPDGSVSSAPSGSPSLQMPELVVRLTNETYIPFIKSVNHIAVVLFYATWHSHSVRLLQVLEGVAEQIQQADEFNSTVRFGAVHGPHWKQLCRGAKVQTFPTLRVYVRGLLNHPHVYTGHDYSQEEVYKFVYLVASTDKRRALREYQEKKAEESKPQKLWNPTPGKVIQVDPDAFAMYRNSTNILMLVLFYAPWCEMCKGTHSTLVGVADYFAGDKSVVIAKMDCDLHAIFCVEKMNIEGYPTFFTIPKPRMGKAGVKYDGGWDVTDLTQHLDMQNRMFEHEGLDEVREQFERLKDLPRDQWPSELSELGGMFANMPGGSKKPKEHDIPKGSAFANRKRSTRFE